MATTLTAVATLTAEAQRTAGPGASQRRESREGRERREFPLCIRLCALCASAVKELR